TYAVFITAQDGAGNESSTPAVAVIIEAYSFSGFFSPINNLPAMNNEKAGKTVPAKFSLGRFSGLSILATDSPASQQIDCTTLIPIGDLQVANSRSGLKYDADTDLYAYNWTTDKSWKGTCRQLVIRLHDGSDHIANFKFK
ncbi:MAG: hypothetical protein ACI9EW_001702, partial [Cellvibrionaceae bacterium]